MSTLRTVGLWAGALLAAAGLVLIWVARLGADRFLYVSELGATGEPTAGVFRIAMTLVASAAIVTALAAPLLRPGMRWLAVVPSTIVLAVAGLMFGVASQITCTRYCPLPVGAAFTWQDLIHTVCAVIGFAAAALVMLQAAADRRFRRLARFSLVAAVVVAVIAGIGGILSLLQLATQLGGILELVATTVALAWLVGLAAILALESTRRPAPAPLTSASQEALAATRV